MLIILFHPFLLPIFTMLAGKGKEQTHPFCEPPNCTFLMCTAPGTEDHIFSECPIAQNAWMIAWKVLKIGKVRLPPFTLRAILQPPPNKPLL